MDKNLEARVKTDIRLPVTVMEKVDEMCAALGLTKNALYTVGLCFLAVQFSEIVRAPRKRADLLTLVEKLFQKTLKKARKV